MIKMCQFGTPHIGLQRRLSRTWPDAHAHHMACASHGLLPIPCTSHGNSEDTQPLITHHGSQAPTPSLQYF